MEDLDLYPMDAVSDFGTDSVSSRPFTAEAHLCIFLAPLFKSFLCTLRVSLVRLGELSIWERHLMRRRRLLSCVGSLSIGMP